MIIRRCTTADTELVAKIGKETYYHTYHHLNTLAIMNAYLEHAFNHDTIRSELEDESSQTFILTIDGKRAAFLKINFFPSQTDLNEEEGMELQRIYVLEEFKRKGLGRTLVEYTLGLGRDHKCAYIWLSAWKKNPSAISFYEKMGFYKAGTRQFKMGEELQSDYILKKELP